MANCLTLCVEIDTLQKKVSELEDDKKKLDKENDDLEQEKKVVEDNLAKTTQDLTDANKKVAEKDAAIGVLNGKWCRTWLFIYFNLNLATVVEKEKTITEINAKHTETKKKLQIRNDELAKAKKAAQDAIKILQPIAVSFILHLTC